MVGGYFKELFLEKGETDKGSIDNTLANEKD